MGPLGRSPARPHVGRAHELSRALDAVGDGVGRRADRDDRGVPGHRRGVLLAGAAGVGKSHLLELVTDRLAGRGWSPLLAQGDPTRRGSPFGAFGDLLPPLTGNPDRWALVLHAGLDHLVERAGDSEPVLVADDLHAFDPASAALVQHAVLDGRVRLVGTLRVGAQAPDAITALWKDDLVERIDLVPLDERESTELAERLVGGPIDAETRNRLWTWTQGNPLLITEIAQHARQHDNWRQVGGLWHLDGLPTQSPRLARLLDERVNDCPPAVADLVDAVALAGRLPLAVAEVLVGRAAVTTAERVRLVRVRDEHGRIGVTLDHPLYGELRRATTPPGRQAALRHRLLDVVESLDDTVVVVSPGPGPAGGPRAATSDSLMPGPAPGPEPAPEPEPAPRPRPVPGPRSAPEPEPAPEPDAAPRPRSAPEPDALVTTPSPGRVDRARPGLGPADLALVAQWYLETDRVGPRTPEILLAAAERAWVGNAPERAAAFSRRAWQLQPTDRSGHLLVSSLVRIGAIDDLEAVAPRVVAFATTDRARAVALLSHAVAIFQFANRPEDARTILRDGARHLDDPGWRDMLQVEEASFDLQMGAVREAEAKAARHLDSPNPRAAADAASVVAPARALQGRIAESVAAAERGLELARTMIDEFVDVGQHMFHLLTALVDDGRVLDAEKLALAAMNDLSGRDDRFSNAFLAVSLGRIYRMRGRPETAARWFREAAASFESVQRIGFTAWCLAGLAAVRAEVGDLEGARAAVARGEALDGHPIGVGWAEAGRSLAWVHVAAGDLDEAAAALGAAADHGVRVGEVVHAGHALHDLVRIGRAKDAAGPLARLVDGADSAFLAACAKRAAASAAADRDGLERAAGAFEALGCDLLAAETWYEASGNGSGWPAPGGARARQAPARRAAELALACEGARTPLLPSQAGTVEVPLSPREREIAELAARGMVRRQIAEHLVISRRTVDSHLQRIYAKIGVTSREALAQVLPLADG